MGVLAPGSAHARPSARPPIDTSGNFPAPVSAEWPSKRAFGLQYVPSAFKTGLRPFCSPKMTLFRGVGGVPKILFHWNPNISVS
jgi:hypothetical protein